MWHFNPRSREGSDCNIDQFFILQLINFLLIILIFPQHYKTITQSISYSTQIRHAFRCESPRKFLFTRYSHSAFSVYIFTTFFYSYRTLHIISYMSSKQSHAAIFSHRLYIFRWNTLLASHPIILNEAIPYNHLVKSHYHTLTHKIILHLFF